MNVKFRIGYIVALCLAGTLSSGVLYANTIITIPDKNWQGGDWYSDREDQEVEPGMAADQKWDLEGYLLDGYNLTVVGGYDFIEGATGASGKTWKPGDIFIDIDGDAVYGDIHGNNGNGVQKVNNTFGYDFVIDLDTANLGYIVYGIDDSAQVKTAYYAANQGSNPWLYDSGGLFIESGALTYTSGVSDGDAEAFGFIGGSHNILSGIDLSFLGPGVEFIVHTTMECGNDNLMGRGITPVPEPSTLLLFLTGMGCIASIRRRAERT